MIRVGFLVLMMVSVWVGTVAGTQTGTQCIKCSVSITSDASGGAPVLSVAASVAYDATGDNLALPACDPTTAVYATCTGIGSGNANEVCGMVEYTAVVGTSTTMTSLYSCLEDFQAIVPPARREKRNIAPGISRAKRASCASGQVGLASAEAIALYCECENTPATYNDPVCGKIIVDHITVTTDTCDLTCGYAGVEDVDGAFHTKTCLDVRFPADKTADASLTAAVLAALHAGNVVGTFTLVQDSTTQDFTESKVVTYEIYTGKMYDALTDGTSVNDAMVTYIGASEATEALWRANCGDTPLGEDPATTTAAPTTEGSDGGDGDGAAGIRNLFIVNIAVVFGYMMLA